MREASTNTPSRAPNFIGRSWRSPTAQQTSRAVRPATTESGWGERNVDRGEDRVRDQRQHKEDDQRVARKPARRAQCVFT